MRELIYKYLLNLYRKIKERNSEIADEKMSKVIEENKQKIKIKKTCMRIQFILEIYVQKQK